jgi:hypothetical protein
MQLYTSYTVIYSTRHCLEIALSYASFRAQLRGAEGCMGLISPAEKKGFRAQDILRQAFSHCYPARRRIQDNRFLHLDFANVLDFQS